MYILFTDLDDTLLNEESHVSAYTKEVLRRFCEAGNKLVLSSGRALKSIDLLKEEEGLDFPGMYIAAYNGCLLYDCDYKKEMRSLTIPLMDVANIQAIAEGIGIHIQTYCGDNIVTIKEDIEINYYRRRIHQDVIFADHLAEAMDREPHKMLAISLTDPQKLEQMRKAVDQWSNGRYQTMYSNDKYLEIFHEAGGKGSAVVYICDCLGIPLNQAIAAGDQANDISMLQVAGCGIAMKNGTDEVHAAADIITDYDYTQDGLAKSLEKLFLI